MPAQKHTGDQWPRGVSSASSFFVNSYNQNIKVIKIREGNRSWGRAAGWLGSKVKPGQGLALWATGWAGRRWVVATLPFLVTCKPPLSAHKRTFWPRGRGVWEHCTCRPALGWPGTRDPGWPNAQPCCWTFRNLQGMTHWASGSSLNTGKRGEARKDQQTAPRSGAEACGRPGCP